MIPYFRSVTSNKQVYSKLVTLVGIGCTVEFLRRVLEGNIIYARRTEKILANFGHNLSGYDGSNDTENFQVTQMTLSYVSLSQFCDYAF